MVARRVSREDSGMGMPQHCLQISAEISSKYRPEKLKLELSEKWMTKRKSHETFLQQNSHLLFCSAMKKPGRQEEEGRNLRPKEKKQKVLIKSV
jgi:hypothetical protein